jgi:DNA-binding transcriptional ArsR family regulator
MTEPRAIFEIDDIRTLEILKNQTRVRIMRQLAEPSTVKQIAERMDAPPTRLYYHVNLLEETGVIRVVETRKAGALVEKVYQVAGRQFHPSRALMSSDHDPALLASLGAAVILDGARVDAEAGLRRHFEEVAQELPVASERLGALGRTIVYLEPESVKLVVEKIRDLLELMDQLDAPGEGDEFGMSYVFFPVAG